MATDPEALINQPYSQHEESGGFLKVTGRPAQGQQPAAAKFDFFDDRAPCSTQLKKTRASNERALLSPRKLEALIADHLEIQNGIKRLDISHARR